MNNIFNQLKHFNRGENWGDPDRMNGAYLLVLDAIRDRMGMEYVVHYGTQGLHSPGSQHPIGNGSDGHFITSHSYFNQIVKLETILIDLQVDDRMGIGIYPAWNTPGFHSDLRGFKARWGWIGEVDPKGHKVYCSYEKARHFAEAMEK